MKTIKPRVRAIAAVTIDGKIAKDEKHLSDWTSPEDKDFLHEKLDESDVVIVGNNTYQTALEPLSKRNCMVVTRRVKTTKKISENCRLVNLENVDIIDLINKNNYKIIDVLGGTQIYSWFLKNNLINDFYLTIEPVVFGSGRPLFEAGLTAELRCRFVSIRKLNKKGSLLLHYKFT